MAKESIWHNVAHVGFGAAIGATGTGLGWLAGYPVPGAIVGVAAASGYGYWREHYHDRNFSKWDFAEWVAGGFAGAVAVGVWALT